MSETDTENRYGDADDDGFYFGELDARSALVGYHPTAYRKQWALLLLLPNKIRTILRSLCSA